MTLEELDNGLRKLGLNLDVNEGLAIRDNIIRKYGQSLVDSKKDRCSHCNVKDRFGCKRCDINSINSDPLKAGMDSLTSKTDNEIDIVPFIFLYVIPEYERVSGEKNTIEKVSYYFQKRWNKEHKN